MRKISVKEWRELFALLDAALDLPVDSRQAWLDRRTDLQPELLDTLRALLAHPVNTFAGQLPQYTAHPDDPDHPATADPAGAGSIIGPYRLLSRLGRGGMSSVWMAERLDGLLKRRVALKLPHVHSAMPALAVRMARERDILATLEHPAIARLYDAGMDADGRPYLALELVDGIAIDEYCALSRPDVTARVRLALQIARAVAYAHSLGIVHCDLKPANILIDRAGQVRLLDFGIAKLLAQEAGAPQETQAGWRAFTPDYAAPEQLRREPATTASDVFSLGVVLYQILCGALPFADASTTRSDPRAPSARATDRRVAQSLRGDLDVIVLKALKESPLERYATMEQFARDLEHFLRGEPVLAKPDTAWYRTRKFVARNRRVLAPAAAIVVGTLAVSAGFAVHQWREREAVTARAIERSADAIASRAVPPASTTRDELAYREYLKARSLMLRPTEANLREILALTQSATTRDPKFAQAHALLGGVNVLFLDIGFTRADALGQGDQAARRALVLNSRLPGAHATLGSVAAHRGEWPGAAEHFQRAFELDDQTGRVHARFAQSVLVSAGQLDDAGRRFLAEFRLTPAHARGAMQVASTLSLSGGRDHDVTRYVDIAMSLGWPGEAADVSQALWNVARRAGRHAQALQYQISWLPTEARDDSAERTLGLLHAALTERSQRAAALHALDAWTARLEAADRESFAMLMLAIQWYTLLGDLDRAYRESERWLAHSARTGLSGIPDNAGFWLEEMRAFRGDRRFHGLAERMGLVDYWREFRPPDGCRLAARLVCH